MPKEETNAQRKNTPRARKTRRRSLGVHRLKLLITVVDRSKELFYLDLLEGFEVNVQMVLYGRGTASSQMLDLLSIAESDKAVIISYIREDKVKGALETLDDKFQRVKNGKGIAYTIALDSIIGVSMYQLLSNDRTVREGEKK
jgi:hypothetical protein